MKHLARCPQPTTHAREPHRSLLLLLLCRCCCVVAAAVLLLLLADGDDDELYGLSWRCKIEFVLRFIICVIYMYIYLLCVLLVLSEFANNCRCNLKILLPTAVLLYGEHYLASPHNNHTRDMVDLDRYYRILLYISYHTYRILYFIHIYIRSTYIWYKHIHTYEVLRPPSLLPRLYPHRQ